MGWNATLSEIKYTAQNGSSNKNRRLAYPLEFAEALGTGDVVVGLDAEP